MTKKMKNSTSTTPSPSCLKSFAYTEGKLLILDQTLLPTREVWLECRTAEEVCHAIESMKVRGAPAIATVAAYGFSLDLLSRRMSESEMNQLLDRLSQTRPTAVNLFHMIKEWRRALPKILSATDPHECALSMAVRLDEQDLSTCVSIGRVGSDFIAPVRPLRILTHCNTGSLATSGYGTALGVIRALHAKGMVEEVFVDETRPYLQGSRLTSFELKHERIPHHIIADSAAGWVMRQGLVDLVIVGADRIASNGDTANKIGTYGLAVLAKHHALPFFVAAPHLSFDTEMSNLNNLLIENRSALELTHFFGHQVSPSEVRALNPSFDVTPGELVTAFFTETNAFQPPYDFT